MDDRKSEWRYIREKFEAKRMNVGGEERCRFYSGYTKHIFDYVRGDYSLSAFYRRYASDGSIEISAFTRKQEIATSTFIHLEFEMAAKSFL